MKIETAEVNWSEPTPKRLHEIIGNEYAKRAIEVAMAGSHETVFLSSIRSPASDLLMATAKIAHENNIPFKGRVIPICLCGCYGTAKYECTCSMALLRRYHLNVGKFLHSADIVIETTEPRAKETTRSNENESVMVARVKAARAAEINDGLDDEAENLLRMGITEMGASRQKILDVASTIAKLDAAKAIRVQHISEAIQYQCKIRWFDSYEEAK